MNFLQTTPTEAYLAVILGREEHGPTHQKVLVGPPCETIATIPTPIDAALEDNPILAPFMGGILACGGRTDATQCQHWATGDLAWHEVASMNHPHSSGSMAVIGTALSAQKFSRRCFEILF